MKNIIEKTQTFLNIYANQLRKFPEVLPYIYNSINNYSVLFNRINQ